MDLSTRYSPLPQALAVLTLPLLAAPALAQAGGTGREAGRVERHLAAMGTWLEVVVEATDRQGALAASEAAVRAIEEVEERLSTWRDDSELARLNQAPPGTPVALSPELARDLRFARAMHAETNGAFDPALGALVAAWGLRTGGRAPSGLELARAREASGLHHLHLAEGIAQWLHRGVSLEEGGFGKGIGLDSALVAARDAGARAGRIDLGGQVLVFGEPATVVVAHPARRDEPVCEVRLASGSLATSGNSERGIVVAGERRSHVLDPRTGAPAADFGSVSVWASSAARADALSTALFVLGPEKALAFAESTEDCDALMLLNHPDGVRVRASAGLDVRLVSTKASLLEER